MVLSGGFRQERVGELGKRAPRSLWGLALPGLDPLTIATSSYGNVILSNFLRDKGTQNVIGYFAPVIFYDITTSIALPSTITVDNYPESR